MKKNYNTILKSVIFNGIKEENIDYVLKKLNGRINSYDKNEYIVRAGERINSLGIIMEGEAMVMQEDLWGNRNVMANIYEGENFGETFSCSGVYNSNVNVISRCKTKVLFLDIVKIIFSDETDNNEAYNIIMRNLIKDMAEKNIRFNEKISHMSKRTTRGKLMSYLSAQALKNGSKTFSIPFTRQQLADYLCIDRSGMWVELGKMKEEGLIKINKNIFTVIEPITYTNF